MVLSNKHIFLTQIFCALCSDIASSCGFATRLMVFDIFLITHFAYLLYENFNFYLKTGFLPSWLERKGLET